MTLIHMVLSSLNIMLDHQSVMLLLVNVMVVVMDATVVFRAMESHLLGKFSI